MKPLEYADAVQHSLLLPHILESQKIGFWQLQEIGLTVITHTKFVQIALEINDHIWTSVETELKLLNLSTQRQINSSYQFLMSVRAVASKRGFNTTFW